MSSTATPPTAAQTAAANYAPVVIPVPRDGDGDVSPPASPWASGLRKLWGLLAILAPWLYLYVIDPLIDGISNGSIELPLDAETRAMIAPALSALIAAYQVWRKASKERARLNAAQAMGLARYDGAPTARAKVAAAAAADPAVPLPNAIPPTGTGAG